MKLNEPTPKVPIELICFIVAFMLAPLISEKFIITIGVFLTYVLIKFNQVLKLKLKQRRQKMKQEAKTNRVSAVIFNSIILVIFFIGCSIMIIIMNYNDSASDTVIYRASQDKVMFEFTFWDWFKARGYHPDYQKIVFDQDPEIADVVANIAYHAQFKFVGDEKLVRSYLEQGDEPDQELSWAVRQCVSSVARWSTKVKHHPDVDARALSISDMNTHCALTHYGYEWVGTLEIVQCYPYPDDQPMRNKCLQTARSIPPYE